MSVTAILSIVVKFLPELIGLIKFIHRRTVEGIEDAQIKRDLRKIDAAFKEPDRVKAAKDINDIFRN